ncbi:MAG: hypothetical protein WC379_03395 [Methanoregula sp.]|jgi:hypothetical protein
MKTDMVPATTNTQDENFEDILIFNWPLQKLPMVVEIPILPKMINASGPGRTPPRGIQTSEIIIFRFSWFGCEPPFMLVSPEQKN